MTSENHIAQVLKDARVKKGYTQLQVALEAKLNPNAYAKMERGENIPTTSSLSKLIKVLDIDPSSLL